MDVENDIGKRAEAYLKQFMRGDFNGIPEDELAFLKEVQQESDASKEESRRREAEKNSTEQKHDNRKWRPLGSFPMPIPDKDNPNILIEGRWLERGGVSFIVSTAGTGKSVFAQQLGLSVAEGIEFCGLKPRSKLNVLIIQSEDSDDRVGIDREDILAYLANLHPEIDWRKTVESHVRFASYDGLVGAKFINALADDLNRAKIVDQVPDIVVINPIYDRQGGDSNKSEIVTAFFAGGEISREESPGLRAIAKQYGIGFIIFAHTGKPPTGEELKKFITSDFPEYQICGSSVYTNFGRSFITMMKLPDHDGKFLLTAGKNGDGLGWRQLNGDFTKRRFMSWGEGVSCCGHGRAHCWRDLDNAEVAELERDILKIKPDDPSKKENDQGEDKNAEYLAEAVRNGINAGTAPITNEIIREWGQNRWTKSVMRKAVKRFEDVREKKFKIGKENGVYTLI